ncbi:MAG: hypothetical protein ACK46X_11565 [Candidatus Sericytochromatia bacterium]
MRLRVCGLVAMAAIAGCQTGPASMGQTRPVVDLLADAGGFEAPRFAIAGPASGAAIAVRLQAGRRTLAKTVASDLKSLAFGLVAAPVDQAPVGQTGLVPVGGLFSHNTLNATATLAFTNVPANAAGQAYHVVVAAFDAPDAQGLNITNATGADAEAGRARLAGVDGPFYVSLEGVRVTPGTNAVSTSAPLAVSLKLAD